MTSPKVSIIILNWNGLKDTVECLESLKTITYPNYQVIVVDNGSEGNDAEVLQEQFGDYLHLVRNDKNYGYTGGNNIGIRYGLNNSSPDYFLILNNDVVVAPDFLTEMVKAAEGDDQNGIVGPKTYLYDTPNLFWLAWANIDMHRGRASFVGFGETDEGQYDDVREVHGYLAGSCLLIKQQVIQNIGLFDESYFCYWDEVDYCVRARRADYKVIYAPLAKVWHKPPMEQKATVLSYYYWARNNFIFMRKHGTKRQYCSFLLYFFGCHFWFSAGVCLLHHRSPRQLVAFCRGTRDGLFNSENGAKFYIKD